MKIRNHKKREYIFYPIEENRQYFESKRFIFKYKSDLIKFLNKHLIHAVNGTVTLSESGFGYSGSIREWFVWYNERSLKHGNIQIELRQLDFRGRKFIHKKHKNMKAKMRGISVQEMEKQNLDGFNDLKERIKNRISELS